MSEETQSGINDNEQQLKVDQSLITEDSNNDHEVSTDENKTPTSTHESLSEDPDEEKQQSRSQNSKQRLKRKLGEAERRNAQLAEQLNAQQKTLNEFGSKLDGVINPPAMRPERVNFETEEDYEDALYDFRQSSPAKTINDETPVITEPVKRIVSHDVRENWLDHVDLAKEKYPDFKEKLEAIPIRCMTDAMTVSIMESESAGELAYFLGCNLSEADRISKLNMTGQVREIDKLNHKFASTTSNAPTPIATPIDPMKGSDSPVADVDKMSMKEYAAYMNKKQFGGP